MDLKGENKALHPVGSIQEHNSFEMKYGSLFYGLVASVCMISGRKISSSSSARATTPISSILARATTPISSIYFASENRLTFSGWFSGVWFRSEKSI